MSEHLEREEGGGEVVGTRRGRPITRLSGFGATTSLEELARPGLVRMPQTRRRPCGPQVAGAGPVSDLVSGQRA